MDYNERAMQIAAEQPEINRRAAAQWDIECRIAQAEGGDLRAALSRIAREASTWAESPTEDNAASLAATVCTELAALGSTAQ